MDKYPDKNSYNIKLPMKLPDIDDEPEFGNPKFAGKSFVPDMDFDSFIDGEMDTDNGKDINEFDADELVEQIKNESDILLKNIIEAKKVDRDLYEKTLMLATKKIMTSGKMDHQIKIIAELRTYLEKSNSLANTKDATMMLTEDEISAIEQLDSVYNIPPRSMIKNH